LPQILGWDDFLNFWQIRAGATVICSQRCDAIGQHYLEKVMTGELRRCASTILLRKIGTFVCLAVPHG
jgi:hypothetical protein